MRSRSGRTAGRRLVAVRERNLAKSASASSSSSSAAPWATVTRTTSTASGIASARVGGWLPISGITAKSAVCVSLARNGTVTSTIAARRSVSAQIVVPRSMQASYPRMQTLVVNEGGREGRVFGFRLQDLLYFHQKGKACLRFFLSSFFFFLHRYTNVSFLSP